MNAPGSSLEPEGRSADIPVRLAGVPAPTGQECPRSDRDLVRGQIPEPGFTVPASFGQQRLWFLHQYAPDSPVYHIPIAFRLVGPLDLAALEHSVGALVQRHESLRTTFALRDGEVVQTVSPAAPLRVPVFDLSGEPRPARAAAFDRRLAAEARLPFDLARGPVFRLVLFRLAREDHVLLTVFHHIISDGWSMGVFARELGLHYSARRRGAEPPLPELPIQYADFSVWQRQQLQGETLEAQAAYWRDTLRGAVPFLDLPADRPRPPTETFRGASRFLKLDRGLHEALVGLARDRDVTLFVLLLAAYNVLLHRYSGQEDITVGTPVANRTREETEGLIGFFVNTLALRANLAGDPPFAELLARLNATALGAWAHQEFPFDKLVEVLQPPRDASRSPLFQVALALQNYGARTLALDDITVTPMRVDTGASVFDLTLFVYPETDGLDCRAEFNTDLFDADRIDRMLGHWRNLLQGIVANPRARLSELPLLSEAERRQVLVEWNQTATPYPRDRCIHELFEQQARKCPAAVALVAGEQSISYGELDRQADQLAGHLRGLGVGPEVLVGLSLERSPERVAALLGILKAGGTYWPLESDWPDARIAVLLADARPQVLLVSRDSIRRFTQLAAEVLGPTAVLAIEDLLERTPPPEPPSALIRPGPESLAYVMYTSGSTGAPKGVLVPHRAVVRLVKDTNFVSLTPDETLLHLAPLSFDASTFEIWGALLNGARLAIVPPHRPSLEDIGAAIRRHRVTTLWLTAPLFHAMVDQRLEDLKPLRQLLAGGDVLSVPRVRRFLEQIPGCRLINGYGPTENTTFTCCHTITSASVLGASIPIGRPIANTWVCLLDERLQPVPVGVPGELCAGGDGLARGYLGRNHAVGMGSSTIPVAPVGVPPTGPRHPACTPNGVSRQGAEVFGGTPKTAGETPRAPQRTASLRLSGAGRSEAAFVPNPFPELPGERLYRTGDLARWRSDGILEFLGRIDRQVKIRGFRVEPAEIEAELGRHAAVAETAVLAGEDAAGNKSLCAYVVLRGGQTASPKELREFLRQRLPDYLVPGAIILTETLPLTASGKVDREALAQRQRVAATKPDGSPERACTELERTLIAIWEKHLSVRPVGVRDNFFALGGNSLLALGVFNDLAKQTGAAQPLSLLFQAPTIEQLAAMMHPQDPAAIVPKAVVAIQPHGSLPPLFCVPGAGVDPLCFRDLARHLGADQPLHGLVARGFDGRQAPLDDLPALAAFFVREMRTVQPRGPYRLGGLSFGGVVAWEMACQLCEAGETVALLVLFDTYGPGLNKGLPDESDRPAVVRAGELACQLVQKVKLHSWMVARLPPGQGWRYLRDKTRRRFRLILGRQEPPGPLQQNARRVYDAQVKALRDYTPRPYPGRMTLFRGALHLNRRASRDRELGWGGLALGGLELHNLPAFHHLMVADPFASLVAPVLRNCLAASLSARTLDGTPA